MTIGEIGDKVWTNAFDTGKTWYCGILVQRPSAKGYLVQFDDGSQWTIAGTSLKDFPPPNSHILKPVFPNADEKIEKKKERIICQVQADEAVRGKNKKEATDQSFSSVKKARVIEMIHLTNDQGPAFSKSKVSDTLKCVSDQEQQQQTASNISIIGCTADANALIDSAHARYACKNSSNKKPQDYCPRCLCYVCDVPVSLCRSWRSHCRASHDDMGWRIERILAKGTEGKWLNFRACLSAISNVETSDRFNWPDLISLKGMYKSSQIHVIARMLSRENSAWSLEGLRTVERNDRSTTAVFGGWLDLDFGEEFEKRRMILSLISMTRQRQLGRKDLFNFVNSGRQQCLDQSDPIVELPLTVIVTCRTIEWSCTCSSHAPNLKIKAFHLQEKGMLTSSICRDTINLQALDILVIHPEVLAPEINFFATTCFHRLIFDCPQSLQYCTVSQQIKALYVWIMSHFPLPNTKDGYYENWLPPALELIGALHWKVPPSKFLQPDCFAAPQSFYQFLNFISKNQGTITLAGDDHSTLTRLLNTWIFRYTKSAPTKKSGKYLDLLNEGKAFSTNSSPLHY